MIILTTLLSTKMMKTANPINLTLAILILSVPISWILFKTMSTSWLPFVLILTFSSGMMTLFIYTASLSPNEKTKTNNPYPLITLTTIIMITTPTSTKILKTSMKTFSNKTLILIMTTILILTMVSIGTHGFNPNQSLTSTF